MKAFDPGHKAFIVRVSADAGELTDFCLNMDMFIKKPDFPGSLHNGAAQGAVSLIPHKEDG